MRPIGTDARRFTRLCCGRAALAALAAALLPGPAALAQDAADKLVQGRSAPYRETVQRYFGKAGLGEPKIINGVDAKFDEHPWQVALLVSFIADNQKAQFCGGSIIADNWVLTAGHCVEGTDAVEIHVLSGTASLASGGKRLNVQRVLLHKRYAVDATGVPHQDIALLQIKEPIDTGKRIAMITPAAEPTDAKPGVSATVTGWGKTESVTKPVTLKKVSVPVVATTPTCNDPVSYDGAIKDDMLCAGFPTGGKDSCNGDSGGPLTVAAAGGAPIQIGIVSWGAAKCALPGKYGVYTRLAVYHDWVTKCMADPARCEAKASN